MRIMVESFNDVVTMDIYAHQNALTNIPKSSENNKKHGFRIDCKYTLAVFGFV